MTEPRGPGVNVDHVESGGSDAVPQVGRRTARARLVRLNGLAPDDVEVQVVYGRSHEGDQLTDVRYAALDMDRNAPKHTTPRPPTNTGERCGSPGRAFG